VLPDIGSGNEQLSETLRKPIPGSLETNQALGKLNTLEAGSGASMRDFLTVLNKKQ